jgi:hypothetical protein
VRTPAVPPQALLLLLPPLLFLQLHEKELVLFAVNDNPDVEWAAGGAHWWGTCLQRQQQQQLC